MESVSTGTDMEPEYASGVKEPKCHVEIVDDLLSGGPLFRASMAQVLLQVGGGCK